MANLPPQLTPQSQSPIEGIGQMSDMGEQMMQGNEEPVNVLAHFTPEEISMLDQMQGQVYIDPETNLRDYTMLELVLKNPQIQDYMAQTLGSSEKKAFAEGGFVGNEQINEPGRPIDPELEKLRQEGRGKDTELAIITEDIAKIFAEMNGGKTNYNPITGFPEYGFFKQLFRVAAGIAGFVAGGPIGAALGAGIAHKATGDTWGGSLKAAGMGLGAGAGFNALAPVLGFSGAAIPTSTSMMGTYLPSWAGGASGAIGPVSGLSSVGKMMPAAGGQAAAQGVGQAGMQAAGQTGGGILGALGGLGNVLPLVGSGLLMAKGHQDEQKGLKQYQQKLEGQEARQRQENEALRERMGFNRPLSPTRPFEFKPTNPVLSREEIARGVEPRHFGYDLGAQLRAGGGAIRGIGKGQQDNIPKNVEENSYIIDASTVSDIGDGSTDAGFKELERYFSKIPSQHNDSPTRSHEAKGGYIKAMVSDGEYEIPPEKVTAIGHGSNEKGAQILKKFVKEIRAKKRTSGEKLPPKSKPIGGYLKGIQHSAA